MMAKRKLDEVSEPESKFPRLQGPSLISESKYSKADGVNSTNDQYTSECISLNEGLEGSKGEKCQSIGIVLYASGDRPRTRKGDYIRVIRITDPSIYPRTLTINFFNADNGLLPNVAEGHILLFRHVKIHETGGAAAGFSNSYQWLGYHPHEQKLYHDLNTLTFVIPPDLGIRKTSYANANNLEKGYMKKISDWSSSGYPTPFPEIDGFSFKNLHQIPESSVLSVPQSSPNSSSSKLVSSSSGIKGSNNNQETLMVVGRVVGYQPNRHGEWVIKICEGCGQRVKDESCRLCLGKTSLRYEFDIIFEVDNLHSEDRVNISLNGPQATFILAPATPRLFQKDSGTALQALDTICEIFEDAALVEFTVRLHTDGTGQKHYKALSYHMP